MYAGLSLDQAPPFRAPLKFFLTAPIFAVLASVLILTTNHYSLHSPNLIAAVHLITLGYMVMIIFGALQQMLPVVAGAILPKSKITADITYYLLTIGLIFFAIGFINYNKIFFFISATLLLLGLFFFTLSALFQLFKVENKSFIVQGIILSLLFFICAFLLGIHLLISHATSSITNLHYDFALLHYNYIFFGFIFLLIVSITIQVVPMFWVTDSFKQSDQKNIIYITTAILICFPVTIFLELEFDIIYKILISIISLYFVNITIRKLKERKRKLKDITVNFYMLSMIFLAAGVLYWILMSLFDIPVSVLVILLGLGFTISVMNGMIYKIVPFLTWFHLSSKGIFDVPTMRDMIPINKMQMQFFIHTASVVIFTLGFFFENIIIIKIAAFLFAISNIIFVTNIYNAAKIYLKRETNDK